jgi:hypothetical protein
VNIMRAIPGKSCAVSHSIDYDCIEDGQEEEHVGLYGPDSGVGM